MSGAAGVARIDLGKLVQERVEPMILVRPAPAGKQGDCLKVFDAVPDHVPARGVQIYPLKAAQLLRISCGL